MTISPQKLKSGWSSALLAFVCVIGLLVIGLLFSSPAPVVGNAETLPFDSTGRIFRNINIPSPNSYVTYKKQGPNNSLQRSGTADVFNITENTTITIQNGTAQCRARVEDQGVNSFNFIARSGVGTTPAPQTVRVSTGAGGTTPDC
ncbi:hypothetical protein [Moorena producens]|uniref:hypothetical protein n=1 Tax=Moorena producens TaxID=1155739 RepID=UPI003C731852